MGEGYSVNPLYYTPSINPQMNRNKQHKGQGGQWLHPFSSYARGPNARIVAACVSTTYSRAILTYSTCHLRAPSFDDVSFDMDIC